LHDVAGRLGVPTSQVLDHFRDLDSVADAWFMRALKAMVGQKPLKPRAAGVAAHRAVPQRLNDCSTR
jgi:hypothetical protein